MKIFNKGLSYIKANKKKGAINLIEILIVVVIMLGLLNAVGAISLAGIGTKIVAIFEKIVDQVTAAF